MAKRHTAELTSRSLMSSFLFWIFCGLSSYIMGWALSSSELGKIYCLWTLLAGPALLYLVFFLYPRLFFRKIKAVNIRKDPVLGPLCSKLYLTYPEIKFRLWSHSTQDSLAFWWTPLFSKTQQIILSENLLSQTDPEDLNLILKQLWAEMRSRPTTWNRVRSLQLLNWMALFLPWDLFLNVLYELLKIMGIGRIPKFQIQIQPLSFKLFRSLFSLYRQKIWIEKKRMHPGQSRSETVYFSPPEALKYLFLGVWCLFITPDRGHPFEEAVT